MSYIYQGEILEKRLYTIHLFLPDLNKSRQLFPYADVTEVLSETLDEEGASEEIPVFEGLRSVDETTPVEDPDVIVSFANWFGEEPGSVS